MLRCSCARAQRAKLEDEAALRNGHVYRVYTHTCKGLAPRSSVRPYLTSRASKHWAYSPYAPVMRPGTGLVDWLVSKAIPGYGLLLKADQSKVCNL
jgi:hypothetical protein